MNIYYANSKTQVMCELGKTTTVANAKISLIDWRLFRSYLQGKKKTYYNK